MGSKKRDFGKSKYFDKCSFCPQDVSVERKHGEPEMSSDARIPGLHPEDWLTLC